MAPRGKPTAYKSAFAEQAKKLCALGATDEDIAEFFSVSSRTIYRWKVKHEEFCQALKSGKEHCDERVERSLYHKAVGYTYDAVKIFQHQGKAVLIPHKEHVPPDTTAAIFWLKNRRPDVWRDVSRQEHTGKDGEPLRVTIDRPPDETREQWLARRTRELGVGAVMGATARPANGRDHS